MTVMMDAMVMHSSGSGVNRSACLTLPAYATARLGLHEKPLHKGLAAPVDILDQQALGLGLHLEPVPIAWPVIDDRLRMSQRPTSVTARTSGCT